MLIAAAIWAFLEAIAFFIVADVLIMAIGLKQGWKRGAIAAMIASIFAAIGGVIMAIWSAKDPTGSHTLLEQLPGIDAQLISGAASTFRSEGWPAMLRGSLSGIPYKIYAHTAGVDGLALHSFALFSIFARLPRFLLIGVIAGVLRPWLQKWLSTRTLWGVFFASWTLFYLWFLDILSG